MSDHVQDAVRTGLAISIRQPWAWLIIHGIKDVENRRWWTGVRGWVGIHAARSIDHQAVADLADRRPDLRLPGEYQVGGIVGRAVVVDCVSDHPSPWFEGPHGFVLSGAEPLDFRECRGGLAFFRPNYQPTPAEGEHWWVPLGGPRSRRGYWCQHCGSRSGEADDSPCPGWSARIGSE